MSSSAELQLAYKVANAQLNLFPYPHFYIRDIFPDDFYRELQANLPDPADMAPIEKVRPVKGYKERFVMELGGEQVAALPEAKRNFWNGLNAWLVSNRFGELVISRFGPLINQRFQNAQMKLYDEALLIEDITNYSLGPHTDSPRKVMSFLFYLPKDESQRHLGTSIYVPKDRSFRCPGGPHYPHANFERMSTMPFLPNSLFAFFKNDVSFHGVEPVKDPDCRRWLLLYDIYVVEQPAAAAPAPAAPPVKFSF
jgi:hypothetical protein